MKNIIKYRKELEDEVGLPLANYVTDSDILEIVSQVGPNMIAIVAEMKETALYKKISEGDRPVPEVRLHPCCTTNLWEAATRISDEHGTISGLTALFHSLVATAERHIKNDHK